MKKLFTVVIMMVLISGCGPSDVRDTVDTETYETVAVQEELITLDTVDEFLFGFDTDSENMNVYEYNGEALSIPFHLDVERATGHDVGFLVFIGGVLQEYAVQYEDGSISDTDTMQKFVLSETGQQKFKFVVTPNVGKSGDKMGIYVCSVIYPSFQPDSVEQPSYLYYGSHAQVTPQQVKFYADAPIVKQQAAVSEDGLELSEEVVNSITLFSTESITETLAGNLYVELYQKDSDETYMIGQDGEVTLHLQLYGGVEGIYYTTLFVNNKPVQINRKDYIRSDMAVDRMSEYEFTLDISDYNELNTIYAVTVPADDAYLEWYRVEKTGSCLLVNDTETIGPEADITQETNGKETVSAISDEEAVKTDIRIVLGYMEKADAAGQMLYMNEKNELVLYDMNLKTNIASYALCAEDRWVDFQKLLYSGADGYAVVVHSADQLQSEALAEGIVSYTGNYENKSYELHLLDVELNVKKVYDLNKIFSALDNIHTLYGICMNADGTEVIVYGTEGIYSYSIPTGEQTQIGASVMAQLQNITITQMELSSDENRLAFLGCEVNQDQYDVYGYIDLKNQEVVMKQTANAYGNTLHRYGEWVYITDGEIPYQQAATGNIICMNLDNGAFVEFVVDNLESTNACLLDDTMIVISSMYETGVDTSSGFRISKYDFATGELIDQEEINHAGTLVGLTGCGNEFLVVIAENEHFNKIYHYSV